ncbi:nitroreductase family protein [Streptomyces sp. NPDC045470]|uniref:nitroreductase family protein n=1 Tax=Streptomyces sp. NPDC045470 TaxID=3155469 RepID=UPI0033C0D8B3
MRRQDWAGQAAFLLVLVARLERMSVKYRTPRCYRVCLLNVGHLGQTFALTATALGPVPARTGAFNDALLAEQCGLDNAGNIPLYVLAAGHPNPAGPTSRRRPPSPPSAVPPSRLPRRPPPQHFDDPTSHRPASRPCCQNQRPAPLRRRRPRAGGQKFPPDALTRRSAVLTQLLILFFIFLLSRRVVRARSRRHRAC